MSRHEKIFGDLMTILIVLVLLYAVCAGIYEVISGESLRIFGGQGIRGEQYQGDVDIFNR